MATPKKTAQGSWRVQVEVKGERDSETFATRREAQAWADKRSVELRTAKPDEPAGRGQGKTLRDALRKFSDEVSPKRRGERPEIVRLAAFEKPEHSLPMDRLIAKFSADDVKAWRDLRLKRCSRGTVLRDLTLLSAVMEQARLEWKWIAVNPVRDVKKPSRPEHRKRIIHPGEIRGILRALGYTPRGPVRTVSQAVAVAFLVALATGMRAGELCGLRWEDMRETFGTAHNVKAIELGVSRDVPLSPVARKLIARCKDWDDALVFGVGAPTLDALFRRARVRAGLEGFTFHDSRHTAATRLAGQLHILDLCKMFGWKNTSQALTYYNPEARDIASRLR
jgi:integrase